MLSLHTLLAFVSLSQAATINNLNVFSACAKVQQASFSDSFSSTNLKFVTSSQDSLYSAFATGERARIDRNPAAIYFAQSEEDVINAVTCAHAAGIRVVPRSGSHSYEDFSSQDGSLVVDLSQFNKVEIASTNGDTGIANVDAGARLGNVYIALASNDFNFNAGTCPSVGIGGHIGGGGYGMLARLKGLAADQTIGMRVVLYNGTVVTANAKQNADLFWALRGGNAGSFGVVTQYSINVFKTPQVTMFRIQYASFAFPAFMDAFMKNMLTVDKRLTVQVLYSQSNLQLVGQFTGGDKGELQNILSQAGMLDNSLSINSQDYQENCSLIGLKAYMNSGVCNQDTDFSVVSAPVHLDPNQKDYGKYKANYASVPLPPAGAQAIADIFSQAPDNSAAIQFEILGGAISEKKDSATPYSNRKSLFSMQYWVWMPKGSPQDSAPWTWIRSLESALKPYVNDNHYQNYPDLDIGEDYGVKYYGAANFEKLKEIKAAYDPTNVFRNEQSIPLPTSN